MLAFHCSVLTVAGLFVLNRAYVLLRVLHALKLVNPKENYKLALTKRGSYMISGRNFTLTKCSLT